MTGPMGYSVRTHLDWSQTMEEFRDRGYSKYAQYLSSAIWERKRRTVLLANPQCCCCFKTATQVHHLFYTVDNLFGSSVNGLASICKSCHTDIHNYSPDQMVQQLYLKKKVQEKAGKSPPKPSAYRNWQKKDFGLEKIKLLAKEIAPLLAPDGIASFLQSARFRQIRKQSLARFCGRCCICSTETDQIHISKFALPSLTHREVRGVVPVCKHCQASAATQPSVNRRILDMAQADTL